MRNPLASLPAWRARQGVVIACIAGAVAACSSQGSTPMPNAPGSEATPQSATSLPADAAGQQAKTVYVGMWQEFAQAGRTSNWQDRELARFATGNALTTLTRSLYADHFNHVVTRGAPKDYPQVTSVEPTNNPDTVMISDCADTTGTSKVMEGSLAPAPGDQPGGRRLIVAEVKRQPDGSWQVDRFAVKGVGTCS